MMPEMSRVVCFMPLIATSVIEAVGLRFDFAGTRRLSAPGGHLVGPGDILPTGS